MNANVSETRALIERLFTETVDKLAKEESDSLISDLYVQADQENGELQVYDDGERLVNKTVIFDWVNSDEEEDVFNKRVATAVKGVLTNLAGKNLFDAPRFMKPLSISLTDDEFVEIEELLFLDDDLLRLDDPLLKDLDADLDNFLSDLLADVK